MQCVMLHVVRTMHSGPMNRRRTRRRVKRAGWPGGVYESAWVSTHHYLAHTPCDIAVRPMRLAPCARLKGMLNTIRCRLFLPHRLQNPSVGAQSRARVYDQCPGYARDQAGEECARAPEVYATPACESRPSQLGVGAGCSDCASHPAAGSIAADAKLAMSHARDVAVRERLRSAIKCCIYSCVGACRHGRRSLNAGGTKPPRKG